MFLLKPKNILAVLIVYCYLMNTPNAWRHRRRGYHRGGCTGTRSVRSFFSISGAHKLNRNLLATHYDLQYVSGHKIAFLCVAEMVPRPHIRWLKDGKEIFTYGNVNIHEKQIGNNSFKTKIEISPATQTNAGVYECIAGNKDSFDLRSFRLHSDFSITINDSHYIVPIDSQTLQF